MNERSYYSVNNYELYHHGIKGQKWGVRRYQNPDGSLTAEGMRRYGLALKGARKMLSDKYLFPNSDALQLVKNKKRFYKELKKNPNLFDSRQDAIINKNNKAYRMTPNKDEKDIRNMKNLYVAVNEKDASQYGRYLLTSRKSKNQYQRTMNIDEDIKAPSVMKMKKYTYEVLNNKDLTDDEFDDIYNKMSKKQKIKLNNQAFNINSIIPDEKIDEKSRATVDKWMEKAKKDNYNAIKDIHDEWYGKSPMILIDADTTVSEIDTKKVGLIERSIMQNYGSYTYDELMDDIKHCEDDEYLIHYGIPGMKWGIRHERETLGTRQPGAKFNRNDYVNYAKSIGVTKRYDKKIKRATRRTKKILRSKWNEYHELLKSEYKSKGKYAKAMKDKLISEQMGLTENEYKLGKNTSKLAVGKAELYGAGKAALSYGARVGLQALLKKAGLKTEEKDMTPFQAAMLAKAGVTIAAGAARGVHNITSAERELKKLDLNEIEEERKKKKSGGQNGGVSSKS